MKSVLRGLPLGIRIKLLLMTLLTGETEDELLRRYISEGLKSGVSQYEKQR